MLHQGYLGQVVIYDLIQGALQSTVILGKRPLSGHSHMTSAQRGRERVTKKQMKMDEAEGVQPIWISYLSWYIFSLTQRFISQNIPKRATFDNIH